MHWKPLVITLLCIQIISLPCQAEDANTTVSSQTPMINNTFNPHGQQEALSSQMLPKVETRVAGKVLGDYPGAILMPIYLWGAIGISGVVYIPKRTSLMELIFFAGGPKSDAELDEVIIKRTNSKKEEVMVIDLEEIIETPNLRSPILEPNDIITIPQETRIAQSDVFAIMSIATSLMGFVLFLLAFEKKIF